MCCYVCCTVSDLLLYIIAIIFPPAAVVFRSGICSSDLLLNVLLTMLGLLPGTIHAFYYISVTSPLRNADYAFFYQQGWIDSEAQTNAGPHRVNDTGYTGSDSTRTPLLRGERQLSVNQALKDQQTHRNSTSLKPGAPPPYSAME
ncbi:Sna4p KNAG_0C04120 [Huiozyma naganishii CBS 8797]|uniref:Plasma membrane proteolipid 3 n=1 Tax=Huiozyma naganishii (strain ATCC MYA-139 / BCRC 22969 / CBS 8797 / KCTC 17520 / NBRC 10181 / NCYC 3082 / Yp74L-3) TaxID=1071383 RepID=J7R3W4_HUIN7|nr:hypothetical protein KNAG_0C04120 [Kazachstania naganishii CBS 8797]CCK69515.1 hypothetical protein KNAG_0C04120 [Kazachstania naganishii CBS 8797]